MNHIFVLLAWFYGLCAFFATLKFEVELFQQEGFFGWLIFGAIIPPIMGLLWPFTTGFLGG